MPEGGKVVSEGANSKMNAIRRATAVGPGGGSRKVDAGFAGFRLSVFHILTKKHCFVSIKG